MNKENAVYAWLQNIKESWTYLRLTEEEKTTLEECIKWNERQKIIKGSYLERYHIMNGLYHTFLLALGYKNSWKWREE